MRDLLPPDAAARRALARRVLGRFGAFGYRLVTPPAFELEDVIERGLGPLASDVLRFVEPESGEVCVLRPDMTPPIARIVATRLASRPPPYRIAYEGTVVRRRMGRAKKQRQVAQVGVELCGLGAPEGDLELLDLARDALAGAGLPRFTIELADAGIARALLAGVPEVRRAAIIGALAKKDEALLAEAARGTTHAKELAALTRLHGGRDALVEAQTILAATPAKAAIERLVALFDAAAARGLAPMLAADAGEVRSFAYYTGLVFAIYAAGPGEPLGGGGRYDELLARFGAPMPAVGFGLDLDALERALDTAAVTKDPRDGVVVVGAADDPRIAGLRARGRAAVAAATEEAARDYARAWGFRLVWTADAVFDAETNAGEREWPLSGSLEEALGVVTSVLDT
jgi:ATP phosphoribosyltransferase regulatory subunit